MPFEGRSYKHPEWKRLLEAMSDKLTIGKLYTYEELEEMAGIDIQSERGRQQFYKFQREALERFSVHFENVIKEGYRIVLPKEHGICSMGRVRRARRQMRNAREIITHVQGDLLTPDERRMSVDLMMRVARLEETVKTQARNIQRLARGVEIGRLPHPLLEESSDDKVN